MDTNKKSYKSNNLPIVIALILIPVLFIFGTMLIVGIVMTANRPNIKLTTSEARNITSSQATFSLSIEGDSNKVNERGFVYGTNPDPKFETNSSSSNPFYDMFTGYNYNSYRDSRTYIELGPNTNTGEITNLYPETKYYVRAYIMTTSGVIYGNEVSFNTKRYTSEYTTNNDIRIQDVNYILDGMKSLRDSRPDIFNKIRNGLAKNMRIDGYGSCDSSIVRESDTILYSELANIGYILPADPNPKSYGCSDYSISVSSNNIITITAPNADDSPISVSSDF